MKIYLFILLQFIQVTEESVGESVLEFNADYSLVMLPSGFWNQSVFKKKATPNCKTLTEVSLSINHVD